MTDPQFRVPFLFDHAATLAWALGGSLVGIRKHLDFTGVFVLALCTSTGGSLVRDAVFLQRTPAFLYDPLFLPLIGATTIVLTLFAGPVTRLLARELSRKVVDMLDALGTAAYAVLGMQLAEGKQFPVIGVVFVGVVTGVAGGLLRDVIVREVPAILRPGQFVALMLVAACALFLVLRDRFAVDPTTAATITVAAFFLMRLIAVRFNWQSRSVASRAGESEWEGGR